MYAIMGQFDNQKIILTRQFFAICDTHTDRAFHSHNCIELSYILQGSVDHIMTMPDGSVNQQKLCEGNYLILDSSAHHAYKNGSEDFCIMNVLFKLPFLWESATDKRSIESSKAFSVTRSKWNAEPLANDIELKFGLKEERALGNKKYIRVWLDLNGDKTQIDFSKACFGLIADGDNENPYLPRENSDDGVFYFLGEGGDNWVQMRYGKDGTFGADSGASVKGFKGWFAFPVSDMIQRETGESIDPEKKLTGIYFYYSMSHESMAGNYLYIDDISLVEDFRISEKGILGDDKVVDLEDGVLKLSVTGKNGNTSADAKVEEIMLSVFGDGDLYSVIKEMYPNFKFSKIKTTPVNQIYFDKDGSVRSLFNICHDCSRKNMHEWHSAVRHALSLIMALSLYSFDEYIRPQKEDIIEKVKKYVDAHYRESITLTEICAKHFYSVPYVSCKFKERFKCSFEQYVKNKRIHHACELLLNTAHSVGDIAEECGYSSVRAFRKAFCSVIGVPPVEFKNNYNK